MNNTNLFNIFNKLIKSSHDNGRRFTITNRLATVQDLLWNSQYRRIDMNGPFHLYSQKSIDNIKSPVVLVSTHIDSADGTVNGFIEEENGVITGTCDATAVNAAILDVMLNSSLPVNVLIAFTGGRHSGFGGALQVAEYLKNNNITIDIAIVLDITFAGCTEGAEITIENNFWDDDKGSKVIGLIRSMTAKWYFVPSDIDEIPNYVYSDRVIHKEAAEDESWRYDELDMDSFSIKLPVIIQKSGCVYSFPKKSLEEYTRAVEKVLKVW